MLWSCCRKSIGMNKNLKKVLVLVHRFSCSVKAVDIPPLGFFSTDLMFEFTFTQDNIYLQSRGYKQVS